MIDLHEKLETLKHSLKDTKIEMENSLCENEKLKMNEVCMLYRRQINCTKSKIFALNRKIREATK